jgi:hypothetical protein
MEGGFGCFFRLNGVFYLDEPQTIAMTIGFGYERITGLRGKTSSSIIGITNDDFALNQNYHSGTDSSQIKIHAGVMFTIP